MPGISEPVVKIVPHAREPPDELQSEPFRSIGFATFVQRKNALKPRLPGTVSHFTGG